jgi:hypothetical protein
MIKAVFVFAASVAAMVAVAGEPLPESKTNTIGYPNVAEALKALKAKPGSRATVQNGWTIVEDTSGASPTIWSFTPEGHPAHPSVVKRSLVTKDGRTDIVMSVHCEATKAPCDDLVRSFQAMNDQMIRSIQGGK